MGASVLNGAVTHGTLDQNAIPEISWPAAPGSFTLEAGQIHLFCAAPAEFKSHCVRFERLLSRAEVERASRFHFAKDRTYYVVRHALLRMILSRYLAVNPSEIEFTSGKFGKPALKSQSLHFNQSDSGELVLFAITPAAPIGVDIECVRPIPDFENIAAQYFCPAEIKLMRALTPEQKMKAFFSCWTSKEAYLKATGQGIADSLNQVEAELDRNQNAVALRFPDMQPGAIWKLRAFAPAPDYLGAVVFTQHVSSVEFWQVAATHFSPPGE